MPHKEGTKRKRNNKKPHQHNNKRKKKQHSQNSTATSSSVSQQGSNSSTSSTQTNTFQSFEKSSIQQQHPSSSKNKSGSTSSSSRNRSLQTLQQSADIPPQPIHDSRDSFENNTSFNYSNTSRKKRKKKKTSLHQQLTPLQKESVHSDQDISSETSTHRSVIVNSSTPTITPVNENQNIASFTSVVSSSLSSPASSSSSSNRPSHWQVVRSLKGFKPKSKNKKNSKNTTPLFNNTTSSSTNSNSEQSSDQEEYFETDSESIMSENSSTQTNTFQSTLENIIQNYGHQIARGTAVPTEQLEEIIQGLKDYSDPTRQFDSVSELCNIIAISNEQTLSRMGIDRFIPELLNILSNNESYDLMVLSARTLLNTMDIYPASCSIVASNGGVNVISQKILSIEYIDLAELSIQMVEHLAHQYGSTLLQEGVLMASLTYIDFFGMDMQKKILRIASSLCKSISKSQYELACDVLPTISRFLSNSEHSMTDSAIFCLTRIVYPFLKDDEKLLNICNSSELLSHATEILSNDKASKNTISLMLKLLKSVSVCSQLVKDIYERGFMHLLTGLLSPERGLHECLIDTLYFILALLPKLPRKDELACQMSHSQRKKLLVRMTEVKPPNQSTIEEPNTPQDKLEALFTEQPTLLQTASEVLLEPLIHIFSSNQNDHVSNILLQIIGTIIYFSPSQMLVETLKDIPFSTFLASLLSSDDISRVSTALQISEILSCKLPSIFDMYFLREGVIHRIKAIGGREPNSSEEFLLDQMRKKTEEAYQKAEQERKEKEERLKKEAIEKNEKIKNKSNNSQSSESETEEQYQDPEKISVSWVEPHVDIPKLPKLSRLYCEKHKKSSFKSSELVGYAVAKAQLIFDKYYERTKDVEMESKNFVKLKAIASSLEKTILAKDINVELEESLLLQIRELIISEDGISNFEFLNSGVAHAIYEYLSRKDGNRSVKERLFLFARILDEDLPKTAASLTRTRSKSFGNANDMLTAVSNTDNKSITANPTYLTELVKKLFDAFNSVENFNINVSETSSIASNVNAVINKLSKQFKLSLTDEQSKKVITLQVHPLARVREVGTFLISKAGETPKEEPEVLNSESTDTSYFHLTERDDDEFIGTVSTIDIETPASEADTSFLSADTMVDEEKSVKYVQLYLNGKLVDENSTLFSIFFKNSSSSSHPSNLNLADTTQNLTFKIVDTKEVHDSDVIMDTNTTLKTSKAESLVNSIIQHCNDNQKIQEENIEKDAIELLDLLKILNCLSKIAPILPHNEKNMKRVLVPSSMFLNPKLASKIVRYIQDPYYLFGDCFPSWLYMLMERYNFMFTFDVRQLYFDLTSKGIARAIQTIQNRFSKSRDRKTRLIQIGKQKVRLSRSPNILESAYKAFTSVETNRIVEFEFKDEVGTGTGPTTELYSLVSRDLQQQGLSIFKDDFVGEHEEKEKFSRLVETKTGLYPKFKKLNNGKIDDRDANLFYFLGVFLGRAILDERVLDIPMSDALLKLLKGETLTFYDIESIDPMLFQNLSKLQTMSNKVHEINNSKDLSKQEKENALTMIYFGDDGKTKLEDLCLSFTVIGTDIELVDKGSEKEVTLHNLDEYLRLLTNYMIHDGVVQQVEHIKKGFNVVMGEKSIEKLKVFNIKELSDIFVGSDEEWTEQLLIEATKCDHGYTHNSRVVKYLFKVLLQMTPSEKRDFLRFITGAPRLPCGGILSLRPKLTIVLKKAEGGKSADMYLPSVMTCTNYLKLPEYSSESILKEQLYKAIQEGQNAFHLS